MPTGKNISSKFSPLRRFGQNFLTSPAIAERIVDSANIMANDAILEIGPGKGVLTSLMAGKCKKIWAVEIDQRLAETLRVTFKDSSNVIITNQDFLQSDLGGLIGDEKIKVVANLPYNITVPILEKLIKFRHAIEFMVVMVQKEMADRLTAVPGNKDYGSLSVYIQYWAKIERLLNVSPGSFFPRPKVTSSVIRLTPHGKPPLHLYDEDDFFSLVRICFSQRRKMLRSVLRLRKVCPESVLDGLSGRFDLSRRAETLDLNEFVTLYNLLRSEKQ